MQFNLTLKNIFLFFAGAFVVIVVWYHYKKHINNLFIIITHNLKQMKLFERIMYTLC